MTAAWFVGGRPLPEDKQALVERGKAVMVRQRVEHERQAAQKEGKPVAQGIQPLESRVYSARKTFHFANDRAVLQQKIEKAETEESQKTETVQLRKYF